MRYRSLAPWSGLLVLYMRYTPINTDTKPSKIYTLYIIRSRVATRSFARKARPRPPRNYRCLQERFVPKEFKFHKLFVMCVNGAPCPSLHTLTHPRSPYSHAILKDARVYSTMHSHILVQAGACVRCALKFGERVCSACSTTGLQQP